jgi:hypothetical protein
VANASPLLLADDVLSLSGHTWATIGIAAGAIAAVAAATFAAWQVLVSILNERKRTQPVVIAHDAGGRRFGDRGNPNTVLPTYLTNEGGGNAFNVRFGVDFDGVRYAWKFSSEDSDNGSFQRVARVGTRLPEDGASFNIEIPWEKFAIGRDTDERRVYWCRYENAYGKTWETRNPVDRSSGLDIRRVRLLTWRLRREERRRRETEETARTGLRRDLEAMAAEAEAAQEAAEAQEQERALPPREGQAPEAEEEPRE